MGATVSDLANAAADTYNPTGNIGSQWTPITVSNQALTNLMAQNGFSGEAWVNTQTGEVIIASRGTVPALSSTGGQNALSDAEISIGLTNHAQNVADQFAAAAVAQAQNLLDPGVTLATVYTTGHSLGGSESQGEAASLSNSLSGVQIINVSFDAPGVGGLNTGAGQSYTSYDFSAQGDLVHLAGGDNIPGTQSVLLPYGPTVAETGGAVGIGTVLGGIPGGAAGFLVGGGLDAHAVTVLTSGLANSSLGGTAVTNLKGLSASQIQALASPGTILSSPIPTTTLADFSPLPISSDGVPPLSVPGTPTGWTIDYAMLSGSEGTTGVGHVAYYDALAGNYVLTNGTTIPGSAVTALSYQSGNSTLSLGVNSAGTPTGAGVTVVQGTSSATVTSLGTGNQVTVSGTVDTSTLQPGQPVPVTTSVGTYHVDPATGDITDSGAVTATINGQTVTLLGLGGSSPFALISNDNSVSTAGAVSSNVLAYPRWSGAASMTPQPLSRRGGPSRISPVGGNRKARRWSSDRLCGFDVREGRAGGGLRLQAARRDRSLGGRIGFFQCGRGLVAPSGRLESAATSVAGHTRRLPVSNEPAKLSGKECRWAHCRHDVSILVGEVS